MIVIPLRFFDMPNALLLEVLAWCTQAGLSENVSDKANSRTAQIHNLI